MCVAGRCCHIRQPTHLLGLRQGVCRGFFQHQDTLERGACCRGCPLELHAERGQETRRLPQLNLDTCRVSTLYYIASSSLGNVVRFGCKLCSSLENVHLSSVYHATALLTVVMFTYLVCSAYCPARTFHNVQKLSLKLPLQSLYFTGTCTRLKPHPFRRRSTELILLGRIWPAGVTCCSSHVKAVA